jgi:uncharacterized protein (TIGR03435 family)
VASVRPFKGSVGPPPSLPGTGAPVRKQAASEGADFHSIEPTKFLIGSAYNIPMSFLEAQIVGGPKWIDTDSYEIRGKIEQNMKAAMDKMPREQRQRQMQLMEQSLLADRFKLKVHFETRELPEWALVIAKGSPKLTPVKALPEDTVNSPISSPGWQLGDFKKGMLFLPKGHGTEMTARSVTLDELVHEVVIVSDPALGGRVVVNQTGLSGTYDFTLRFGVEQPTTTGGEDVADDAPPLLTAVQQQLGLKLVPTKGPVEVLVIDSIEKPVPQDEARFVGPGPTLPTRVVPGEGQVLAPPSAGLMPVALAQIGAAQANPPNGSVAESPIARVNGQVIGRGDYERAQQQLLQEAQRDHVSQAELETRQNDLLRNLIDQRLLLQRGKELNISPDAEVAREMDAIRTTNHLATTADLERAVGSSGTSIEDFKANLRNTIIVRTVVSDEVAPNLRITTSQEQAYYDQHKQDFAQPEQVRLSEILIPTPDNPTDFQITQAQSQADQIVAKLKAGASFEALARQYSSGPNAATGGDLGAFGPGTLPKPLADQTASLKPDEVTAPVRTRQGFVLLKVTEYQAAGTPPFSVLDNQVKSAMYEKAIQPALRTYLTALRAKARIEIAPGFVDTGSSAK